MVVTHLQRSVRLFSCPCVFVKTNAAGSSRSFLTPEVAIEMRIQRGMKQNMSRDEAKSTVSPSFITNEDMSFGVLRHKSNSLDRDKGFAVPKEVEKT